MEKIFLALLALNLLVWLLTVLAHTTFWGGDLLRLAAEIVGLIVAFKLLRAATRRVLWRVRNRMIVLFLFVGLVPLLLVTGLVGLAGYILIGQGAVYMASSELDRRAGRLYGTAAALVWSLDRAEPRRRVELVNNFLEHASESWPGLVALVRDSGRTIVFPGGSKLEPSHAPLRTLRGIVKRDDIFYLVAHASSSTAKGTPEPPGSESVIAPQPPEAGPPAEQNAGAVDVVLLQPLTESYLAGLAPGLGRIVFWPWHRTAAPPAQSKRKPREGPELVVRQGEEVLTPERNARRAASDTQALLPAAAHRFDYEVVWGTAPFPVPFWGDGGQAMDVNILVHTRPSAVYRLLFGRRVEVAGTITAALIVLGVLFLIVESISLFTGVSITRTLTNSVHALYEGTQKVNRGDFSHRIQISGHDQLAELSRSFNSMTESIERLIEESKERQRLASELEIAREVQAQLFPKASPEMRGLEVLGVCNAARMVSGDYYDFVKVSDERLALAIGDVAGKGISGALLMASIQSMLRTQLSTTMARVEANGGVWRFPTSELVSQMNLQLYQNTSPEKYATFFFGAYDDRSGLLTYTNAGHLPPVLVRGGEPRRLEVNGMVVGAFPFARYEQSEIELCPGDLLVAFTDGVTEPENEFAEEFGEERLIELVVRNRNLAPRELIGEVTAAVGRWTGRPELQDDMTMLVARRV